MNLLNWVTAAAIGLLLLTGSASAQMPAAWHDPSPHKVQFVTVDKDVKLEVLDWGGTGRPLVFLAGLGNTAHVFDDFAPKLTNDYHVYGITRRGYGASSAPASGYEADRLGDDVIAVIDALGLERPVLVGHSIAGEELSSVGTRHPERVAGLIYLDGAYAYAYYSRSVGNFSLDLDELQKKLEQLKPEKGAAAQNELVVELLRENLPEFEKDLRGLQEFLQAAPAHPVAGPSPTAEDLASFAAYIAWNKRVDGISVPESELRQIRETRPDGGVGKNRNQASVRNAINEGGKKYTELQVPILAIYANPRAVGPYAYNSPGEREAAEKLQIDGIEAQAKALESEVPTAHVVRLANANQYVFLSNKADVLREMRAFLAQLH